MPGRRRQAPGPLERALENVANISLIRKSPYNSRSFVNNVFSILELHFDQGRNSNDLLYLYKIRTNKFVPIRWHKNEDWDQVVVVLDSGSFGDTRYDRGDTNNSST